MSLTPDEIKEAIRVYREEFEKNFPGEDALKVASQFCNHVLQSKMETLLKMRFAFREPLELIAILKFIHDEQAKKGEVERRPGRPRKPRGAGAKVQS